MVQVLPNGPLLGYPHAITPGGTVVFPEMKRVLSHLVLLAVVTTACADSFSPSTVAGVYERVDVPAIPVIQIFETAHNGQPAILQESVWVDWEHVTLTAASNWTREVSRRKVVTVFTLTGMFVDSIDIPLSSPVILGSFTLSPPDSIFLSDGSETVGGTIVPPDLVILGTTYTRR